MILPPARPTTGPANKIVAITKKADFPEESAFEEIRRYPLLLVADDYCSPFSFSSLP